MLGRLTRYEMKKRRKTWDSFEMFFHIGAGPPAVGALPFVGAICTAANKPVHARAACGPERPRGSARCSARLTYIALAGEPLKSLFRFAYMARATS